MWRDRLEHAVFFPEVWSNIPGATIIEARLSVRKLRCHHLPRVCRGGWAMLTATRFPVVSRLKSPRKGLIGPWAHLYPHDGVPGPAIGSCKGGALVGSLAEGY